MGKNCAPCCPVIRVKCSTRRVRGKLRCTVRMAGKVWKRAPDKAAAKVKELQARLMKKGCRGDVQEKKAALPQVRAVLRQFRPAIKQSRRRAQAAASRPYSVPRYAVTEPYTPHHNFFDGY